ncbi:polysaccharide pyruvyl transferase family protein [Gordonia sp. HY002]|uniref:polysaccharide pyruvyl transferase family protein n=1 Tax=Gordonia zhenghanii TaxID=2911516 RepID=UPI001EF08952|nr:polysaccharide pyruvyl transferase family protein [Gordonia zhenghanii]MCF8571789.1 polysaccharide pyruvyl transferase family protein [Gordonia zhenghanii]MCF8604801.1 polysaccharide pyruvyl transferase family protein [Gordonia zhenghanii]
MPTPPFSIPSVPSTAAAARRLSGRLRRRVDSADVVYLVTTSGFPNYGDELITEAWLRLLAVRRPTARVVVDSPRPGHAALLLRHANKRAVFVDTLWQFVHYANSDDPVGVDPDAPWEWVGHAASHLGVSPRDDAGVDALLQAGTIHLVGGGFVNAMWPHHRWLIPAIAAVAERTGARAVATGAGLTPSETGPAHEAMLAAAARFDVFDVRDAPTEQMLAGLPGLSRTGDDAWLSPRVPTTQTPPGSGSAGSGVVLCAQSDLTDSFTWDDRTGVDALASFVRAVLDDWDVPGSDVTVVECIPGHDYTIPTLLGDRLDGARIIPFRTAWHDSLPTGGTWLSTRYHPHMLAAAGGASGVAVSASPDYYATKHQALVDAGSRWTVVAGRVDETPERPTAGGFTVDAVRANVADKRELARRLYPVGIRLR